MRSALGLVLVVGIVGCGPGPTPGPTAAIPRGDAPWWVGHHAEFVARAQGAPADIVWLGDSLTQGWLGRGQDIYAGDGLELWRSLYEPRRAVNFGLGSDRVEHLIWRIRHGTLGRLDPRLVVVLIGTNNLDRDSPESIAEGVGVVIDEIRLRLPRARILLLGVFPRGALRRLDLDRDRPDPRVDALNRRLAKLDARERVTFLDIGGLLVDAHGQLDRRVFPDFLHLSREGYARWARAIEPTMQAILDDVAMPGLPEPPITPRTGR